MTSTATAAVLRRHAEQQFAEELDELQKTILIRARKTGLFLRGPLLLIC